ncbi:MAG: S-layer homology domain-containing protein [Clostridia bacterium]|nr:S-layer homology domain-containing protein [Clostridia bacterium]
MKKTKRIVTLILAFVMIVSTMSISTFAADFSDIEDEKVNTAVNKLVANGIITGYEDGTFRPDNQITRAEFAAIVTRMKGVAGELGADAVTGFSDLDSDESRAWARPYVKAAVDLGIINGFEDGTFRAGEPVTYEQAVKMLVCAVGYEIVAQSEYNKLIVANPSATWSAGYIAAANKHGITKSVITAKISEPASRGVVAVLTSNALDVPPLKQNEDGTVEKGDSSENEEKTVVEVKGIVSGTYYTGIQSTNAGISLNEIKITTVENGEETYELSSELAKSIDFEDLIGKGVTAYYNTLDRQLTSISKANNKITLIDEASLIRPVEDGIVKYYNENKKISTFSLSDYTVIYNGKYIPSNSDIIENFNTNFTNGKIELVETSGRKFAKVTSYEVHAVDSYNRTSGKITFKYDGGYYTFPSSTDAKPIIYVDGVKKEFDSLSLRAYNIINLMESPEGVGGNPISKMYVTTKSYNGKVNEVIDSVRKVILNSKEYYLTNEYADFSGNGKAPFALNDTYKYYLDFTGQIAAVDYNPVTSSEYDLGYIVDADKDTVNLMKKDKTFEFVPMKSKVKVDGVSTDNDDVKAKLEEIAQALYGEAVCSQPVKYIITNDGELAAIDTAAQAEKDADGNYVKATAIGSNSDDTFIYNDGGEAATTRSSVKLGGTAYQVSSSTMVIFVPENRTSDAEYSIMAPSKAFAGGGDREVKIFGADPEQRTKQPTMVLIYGVDPAYDFVATSPYMVVTDIDRANLKITGFANGTSNKNTVTISEDKFKSFADDDALVEFADVSEGDIIRYITDATGVIVIEMVYDASADSMLYSPGPNNDYMYFSTVTSNVGELKIRYAEAFDIIGTTQMSVTKAMGSSYDDAAKQEEGKLFTYKLSSSTNVYRVDEEGNIVLEETDYKYDNISISAGNSSEIIVISTDSVSNTAKAIYIVK